MQLEYLSFSCPEGFVFEGSFNHTHYAWCYNWSYIYDFDHEARCRGNLSSYFEAGCSSAVRKMDRHSHQAYLQPLSAPVLPGSQTARGRATRLSTLRSPTSHTRALPIGRCPTAAPTAARSTTAAPRASSSRPPRGGTTAPRRASSASRAASAGGGSRSSSQNASVSLLQIKV